MADSYLDDLKAQNAAFVDKSDRALRKLFADAKEKNEVQFAIALNPEFRGMQDAGWNGAEDTLRAFDDYAEFLDGGELTSLKARAAISFYCHLSEASGHYEVPKNMLRILDGDSYSIIPFKDLVEKHRKTGNTISPNSNKIIRDLTGHAKNLGLDELAETFSTAFDPEIRNGYAHADYVVWQDSLRLPMRNGGNGRKIPWPEFFLLYERGIGFFERLQNIRHESVLSYTEPKTVYGSLNNSEKPTKCVIHADPVTRSFSVRFGG